MKRNRGRSRDRHRSVWTWVGLILAIALVLAVAARRVPLGPGAAFAAEPAGSQAQTAPADGQTEAESLDAEELEAWLDKLRQPNRRENFLEAAAKLEQRWDAHEDVQPLVEQLLTMPQYSASAVWRFVGQDLRRVDKDDHARIKQLAEGFARFGAEGYAEGLRLELQAFVDRNPEVATEDQRKILQAIGREEITEADEDSLVKVTAIEQHTLAQFIDLLPEDLGGVHEQALVDMLEEMAGLTHDVYHPIDRAIGETHDYVALACSRYLWSAEHAPLIRKYMTNRLDRSEHYGTAIREMYNKLNRDFPR